LFVPADLFGGGNKQITTMYIIDRTNRSYSRSLNRSFDYHELKKQAKTNPDPGARALAYRAMEDIKLESKDVKNMREALITAHRRGDEAEVRDIHDIVRSKKKYRHD